MPSRSRIVPLENTVGSDLIGLASGSKGQKDLALAVGAHVSVRRRRVLRRGWVFLGLEEYPPVVFRPVVAASARVAFRLIRRALIKRVPDGRDATHPYHRCIVHLAHDMLWAVP